MKLKNLTKKEAIEEHRKMWNWIADECLKKKRLVAKTDYFKENGIDIRFLSNMPLSECFCCQYSSEVLGNTKFSDKCKDCPIQWVEEGGTCNKVSQCTHYVDSPYRFYFLELYYGGNYERLAEYARRVANLPEVKDKEEENSESTEVNTEGNN